MKNFRIYKYQWGLWLAEYLPGREIRYTLHFLRVKWEMLGVYSKSFLSQLTSTITCHAASNLASRRVCLKCLPWELHDDEPQRLRNLSPFVFAEGIPTNTLLMGKQSLGDSPIIFCLLWLELVHCDITNDFPLKTSLTTR